MEAERLFDPQAILRSRRRARADASADTDFLLNLVCEELAVRLSTVERRFEQALTLHAQSELMASLLASSGKVGAMSRLEQHADFLDDRFNGVVTDLESLPITAGSTNLLVAPLSMHLVNDLPGLLLQIRQALSPDGLFLAALPGAGTLGELRECLLQAETELSGGASPRVIPFADIRDCGSLMQRAGFTLPVIDAETYTVRYDTMFDLMKDLRAMGMSNPLTARSRRPASRQLFMRAADLYARRFSDADGRIRATFRILYLSGWSPHASQQKPLAPGSAQVSLANFLESDRTE